MVSTVSVMAYTCHTVVGSILKQNKQQENNKRDLGLTFFVGFLIYVIIGVIGGLGLTGKIICC
jgi:sodium-coupled neutral amino acid transporter 9